MSAIPPGRAFRGQSSATPPGTTFRGQSSATPPGAETREQGSAAPPGTATRQSRADKKRGYSVTYGKSEPLYRKTARRAGQMGARGGQRIVKGTANQVGDTAQQYRGSLSALIVTITGIGIVFAILKNPAIVTEPIRAISALVTGGIGVLTRAPKP